MSEYMDKVNAWHHMRAEKMANAHGLMIELAQCCETLTDAVNKLTAENEGLHAELHATAATLKLAQSEKAKPSKAAGSKLSKHKK